MRTAMIGGAVIGVALLLRLLFLDTIPPSPSLDEVSIGYNAYSILQTGRDEYKTPFPLLLRAYDDYRPALYVYAVIPMVWLFGLTAFSVRFSSVLLSVLTVVSVYGIARHVMRSIRMPENAAWIAALMLAVSPWHIYISRLGHEANLGLALTAFSLWSLFAWVDRGNWWYLFGSAVFWGLTVHGYQSEKIVTPLLLLGIAVLYRSLIKKRIRQVILPLIAGVLIIIPALSASLSKEGAMRFAATSAFTASSDVFMDAAQHFVAAKQTNDIVSILLYNRYATTARVFFSQYFSHFSPLWLSTGGYHEAFKAPFTGLVSWIDIAFFIIGMGLCLRLYGKNPGVILLLLVLFTAPIPAALTTQAPHAMRSYTMVLALSIFEAIGIVGLYAVGRKKYRLSVILGLVTMLSVSRIGFVWSYLTQYPVVHASDYQYALGKAIAYVTDHRGSYSSVSFSNQGPLYQSYMFYLYYTKFDPTTYQSLGGTISGGFDQSHTIGTVSFGRLPTQKKDCQEHVLYLYPAGQVPEGLKIVTTIHNPTGEVAIEIASL